MSITDSKAKKNTASMFDLKEINEKNHQTMSLFFIPSNGRIDV